MSGAGWTNSNIAFIRSGGYTVSKRIPELQQEVLVLWGRNDEIVECKYAENFARDLPHSRYDPVFWRVSGINQVSMQVFCWDRLWIKDLRVPSECNIDHERRGIAAG